MAKRTIDADTILKQARPLTHQHAHEIQPYGHLVKLPIALAESACKESVENLNQLLADTMTLRDLYKKHHWQVAGPTFYQLHLLFDKHYEEQSELVDTIAERIQLLGGVSLAMAADVAETTLIPRPPKGREEVPVQISRLLHAHEIVLKEARTMARLAAKSGREFGESSGDLHGESRLARNSDARLTRSVLPDVELAHRILDGRNQPVDVVVGDSSHAADAKGARSGQPAREDDEASLLHLCAEFHETVVRIGRLHERRHDR